MTGYIRSIARGGLVILRFAMVDYLELHFETIGATLRKQASGMRELAGGILDGEFRGRLLGLALDYEYQAITLERTGDTLTVCDAVRL
jgi:hypothetical protein